MKNIQELAAKTEPTTDDGPIADSAGDRRFRRILNGVSWLVATCDRTLA